MRAAIAGKDDERFLGDSAEAPTGSLQAAAPAARERSLPPWWPAWWQWLAARDVALLTLLYGVGLRISEALSLECSDAGDDGLHIRKSKHGKSRLVPLHETTQAALNRYLSERARWPVLTKAVFVSSNGQSLMYPTVRETFLRLMVRAGLRKSTGSGPRIHDLRHTFAVRSLEQCRPDRQSVAQHMVALSTYLGHATITETYWYLEATPIIMRGIAIAGEAMHQGGEA